MFNDRRAHNKQSKQNEKANKSENGDTAEEEKYYGGRTQEEEDFFRRHFEGDMFDQQKNHKKTGWGRSASASNPKDPKNFDF